MKIKVYKLVMKQAVLEHTFNPSIWKAEAGNLGGFVASLVYTVSFRTTRATQ